MNNKFNLGDDETRAAMNSELKKFPDTVKNPVPNNTAFSVVYDQPIARPANVKDVYNRNYSTETGTPLSHPLQLMTMILNENPWCSWAMATIASSCASTDPLFQVYSKADGRNKEKASARRSEQLVELLSYPNLHQNGYELFLTTYENLTGYGNAYWQIIRNKKGEIHSIYTLPPETIRVIPYEDEYGILHCAYYQMDLVRAGYSTTKAGGNVYLEHEIIHFKETNEKSFLYGKPRLYPLLSHITSNESSMNAINNWFEEGWTGGAIFKMDADELVAARNREFLRDNYSGAKNFGKMLLMEGSIELVDKGGKFVDNIKFEEIANLSRDTILACLGVPVSMAGVRSDAGQGNAEVISSEEKAFKRNTIDRMHALVFNKIQQKLIRGFMNDKDLQIQPGVLSKFNLKDSIDAVRALGELGISIQEAREMLGMKALELDTVNKTYLIKTNNGVVRFEDIIGVDPNTGERVETILEKSMAMAEAQNEAAIAAGGSSGKANKKIVNTKTDVGAKAKELTGGSTGLGGDLKKQIEGK